MVPWEMALRGTAMLDYASTGILDFAGTEKAGSPSRPARTWAAVLEKLYSDAGRRAVAKEGSRLVHRGELFRDLYAVHTGMFKAYINDARGREQVLGLFMPGDIIGFDALETGRHRVNFTALERSEVVAVPFDTLNRLLVANSGLLTGIMRRMALKIAQA